MMNVYSIPLEITLELQKYCMWRLTEIGTSLGWKFKSEVDDQKLSRWKVLSLA